MWSYAKDAYFTLGNLLIGAFNLTKNADSDQSSYSGYGIGFDVRRSFNIN